jgi:nucleoside 2-deoxyribosyltransferase
MTDRTAAALAAALPAGQRVYIAGPITGNSNYREQFDQIAAELRSFGFEPANPAADGTGEHPWSWYMRRALRLLLDSDAVLMLPGWEQSRGATFEHYTAVTCGIPVVSRLAGSDE